MIDNVPDLRTIVIRMKRMPHIDQAGGYVLKEVVSQMNKREIPALITGIQEQPPHSVHGDSFDPRSHPRRACF